ncbi:MAG: thiamine phosphate synthase [Acidobacteria bacterium]|nr:MAG: thiamine phosphate synthase [Acidobacteriota bacterium]
MSFDLPKLYPITDRRLSGLSHAEQVARLSDGGACVVQLREKHLSPREFYREAEEALRVARARGVRLVINDRADIALALGADSVHLGQDDMPPGAARSLLGDKAIIGFSTHSIEQAARAARLPVDYVAIGPVFATSSKENPDAAVGLEGVARVRESVGQIYVVAIGGINEENARAVLDAGADSVAVISALLAPRDPSEITLRVRRFLDRL